MSAQVPSAGAIVVCPSVRPAGPGRPLCGWGGGVVLVMRPITPKYLPDLNQLIQVRQENQLKRRQAIGGEGSEAVSQPIMERVVRTGFPPG
ncbi:hypothetical protein Slala05_72710 [Streptomyces lavendulae subsp. lavendulae]|nr:hypothetical protein Slala05_72710 [Streptomyces lavendulae subsp. lavendulae]